MRSRTFRLSWQAGNAAKTAGEQGMRVTLRAHGDSWQIVSEQVEQIHWMQKAQWPLRPRAVEQQIALADVPRERRRPRKLRTSHPQAGAGACVGAR